MYIIILFDFLGDILWKIKVLCYVLCFFFLSATHIWNYEYIWEKVIEY